MCVGRTSSWQVSLLVELAVTLTLCTVSTLAEITTECRDMEDSLSSWAQQLGNLSYSPTYPSTDTSRFRHNLQAVCPAMPEYRTTRPGLHRVSLCPWTYITDFDYDRFPHQMVYAQCSCGRCASPNGVQHLCRPLYQSFHVIRRVCEEGAFRYRFAYESLPIACICSYRETFVVD